MNKKPSKIKIKLSKGDFVIFQYPGYYNALELDELQKGIKNAYKSRHGFILIADAVKVTVVKKND